MLFCQYLIQATVAAHAWRGWLVATTKFTSSSVQNSPALVTCWIVDGWAVVPEGIKSAFEAVNCRCTHHWMTDSGRLFHAFTTCCEKKLLRRPNSVTVVTYTHFRSPAPPTPFPPSGCIITMMCSSPHCRVKTSFTVLAKMENMELIWWRSPIRHHF
jgi:hypothetical protein